VDDLIGQDEGLASGRIPAGLSHYTQAICVFNQITDEKENTLVIYKKRNFPLQKIQELCFNKLFVDPQDFTLRYGTQGRVGIYSNAEINQRLYSETFVNGLFYESWALRKTRELRRVLSTAVLSLLP
jgi:hypothetical protein